MIRPVIRTLVIATLLLASSKHCPAQTDSTDTDDFIPREQVIFYDDFSEDKANTFPAHWYIQPVNGQPYTSVTLCTISKTGENAVAITANDNAAAPTTDNLIEPRMTNKDYLPDSFTIQYDFILGSPATAMVMAFYTSSGALISLSIYNKGKNGWTIETANNSTPRSAAIPGDFPDNKWHHFALSFYKRRVICYVDDTRILTLWDGQFDPARFILSAGGQQSVMYANVRIATGKYLMGEHYNFGRLFLADKFMTHSIHFDTKKSTIQAGSMEFIRKLAGWLKQNPTVRMEIDGHTDNEGEAAANMKLSQERADEVKKQLVAYGINALRITTKGYGASVPIQPNTTPEGKADNRRVEFIKR